MAAGQLTVTVVLLLLALVMTSHTPFVIPVLLMVALGIGQAYSFLPIQAAALDTVPHRYTGQASALYNVTRQAGSAVGVAVAATVITTLGTPISPIGDATTFRVALLTCAVWSLLGCLIAWLTVHDQDAPPAVAWGRHRPDATGSRWPRVHRGVNDTQKGEQPPLHGQAQPSPHPQELGVQFPQR